MGSADIAHVRYCFSYDLFCRKSAVLLFDLEANGALGIRGESVTVYLVPPDRIEAEVVKTSLQPYSQELAHGCARTDEARHHADSS